MEILSFRGIVNLTANYILETMRMNFCPSVLLNSSFTIRINVSKIKLQSRVTSGVKLISLNKDDEVIAIGRIGPEDE